MTDNHNDDGYTSEPTHIRIYVEEGGLCYDEHGQPTEGDCLTIDGADDEGRYTEGVWSGYTSVERAVLDVPNFIRATEADGVQWKWNPDRPKGLRRAPLWGTGAEPNPTNA